MTTRQFPIDNLESWFFYNLDITTLPTWYEENTSTAKRLERIAQILARQGRFNEYTKTEINALWDKAKSLEEFIEAVRDLLLDEIAALTDRVDDLQDEVELIDGRVDYLETEVTDIKILNDTQNLRLTALEIKMSAVESLTELLEQDVTELKTDVSTLKFKNIEDRATLTTLGEDINSLGITSTAHGNAISNLISRVTFLENGCCNCNPPTTEVTIFEFEDYVDAEINLKSIGSVKVFLDDVEIYEGILDNTNLRDLIGPEVTEGTIKIEGNLTGLTSDITDNAPPGITRITEWADTLTTVQLNFSNLLEVPNYLPSGVTSLGYMFQGATSFNQNLSEWDTSNVTRLTQVFRKATSFNQDIGGWDTSNVTALDLAFYGATSFNGNISSWDVSSVKSLNSTFSGATSFNQNLSNWDMSSVTSYNNFDFGATAWEPQNKPVFP